MLLSFRFVNHRSFRDEQQLNLTPIYDSSRGETPGEDEALKVTGIFGANASGKSNLVSALSYMSRLVGQSDREVEPGLGISRQPFKLNPSHAEQPSSYVADLLISGVRYTYGFTLDDNRIIAEWLYSYPFKRKRTIFLREYDEFSWGEESGRSNVRELEPITSPTALFLSVTARFGRTRTANERYNDDTYAALHEVYTWLYLRVTRPTPRATLSRVSIDTGLLSTQRRKIAIDLLKAADVGLRDVILQKPNDQEALFPLAEEEITAVAERNRARGTSRRGELELQFLHYGAVGNVALDLSDESSGTVKLLELATRGVPVLENGGLFLVDEIDASLHPLLSAALIGLFQSPITNKNNAQLIFTSHDATLLGLLDGNEVLHRDQVWFVEKERDGASIVYPLAEFKPRKEGENRTRRYLLGSYGAIPDLSRQLFERALAATRDDDGE
jgi:predicted ATPase